MTYPVKPADIASQYTRESKVPIFLHSDLANLRNAIVGIIDFLKDTVRSDNRVGPGRVPASALDAGVRALLAADGEIRGAWTTATAYRVGDIVSEGDGTYIAAITHTSGVFATDLAAAKWLVLVAPPAPSVEVAADLAALKALITRPSAVHVQTGSASGTWVWSAGATTTADDISIVQCTTGDAGRYLLSIAAEEGTSGRGCITVVTRLRTVRSARVDSSDAHRLADAVQTPAGSTITVKTVGEHGLTTGASVTIRMGGWHGVTKRAHPANGTWTITVDSTKSYILQASVWAAGSVFLHGLGYSTALVNARPTLTALMNIAKADGGGVVSMPDGVFALLTKEGPTNTGLGIPDNVTLAGAGKDATALFLGDGFNGFGLQSTNTSNWTLRDFTLLGNRQYLGVGGYHAFRAGGDAAYITNNGNIINVAIRGAHWSVVT